MVLTSQNACDILELPFGADINLVITKYKQLALKWHPEKHKYSAESVKKFKQVTLAYKRLTSSEFNQDLNMNDCLQLFHQVLFNTAATNGTKYYSDSSDSSDDDDVSEDSDDEQFTNTGFTKKESNSSKKKSENDSKNLAEDEKERKRVEKRRAKKKRQRERKRLEKEQKTNGTSKISLDKRECSADSQGAVLKQDTSQEDDTQFDPTSAFFTKVVSKKKKSVPGEDHSQTRKKERTGDKKSDEEADETVDAKVLRSRQLAVRGNEMAQVEQYTAAIQLFTEAISLDPTDFRFFGNRSYCYDRIEQHEKALRDAEKAISLDKDWPKGYFRKGRALAGLKMYPESEKAFLQVLKLDKNCDEAVSELFHVRTRQLMDMGFSSSQSEAALKKHGSVQAAMDSLLAGVCDATFSNLHISDDEENNFHLPRSILVPPHISHAADTKMDLSVLYSPANPEGLTALWVGNVLPSVTEKRLTLLFSKYGQVTSVRPLPEKFCAFVNFKTKEAAGRAMHHLQGAEIDGQKLLIKFPDNPIANGAGNFTIRKNITNGATKQGIQPKQTGPVNGVECYFWRTTGCSFGSDCKYQHYPKSKGIDKKPWQKLQKQL
ncbi:hypothetical protein BsWGS_00577 [Bradybaena similaris]